MYYEATAIDFKYKLWFNTQQSMEIDFGKQKIYYIYIWKILNDDGYISENYLCEHKYTINYKTCLNLKKQ